MSTRTVVEQTPLPRLAAVRIGRLPVPTWMAHWAIAYGSRAFGLDLEKVSWSKIIHPVTIRERAVAVTYEWQENAFTSLRGVVIPSEDRERIAIYQELTREHHREIRPEKYITGRFASSVVSARQRTRSL
jgi:hypothetical protein